MKNVTKFKKEYFDYSDGWLTYRQNAMERPVFVARFKYNKSDKPSFVRFLVQNMTVEEYNDLTIKQGWAPLQALALKGYVPPSRKNFDPELFCRRAA
jgi:hypothetical protein